MEILLAATFILSERIEYSMPSPEDEIHALLYELEKKERDLEFDFFRLILADESILFSDTPQTYFSIYTNDRDISTMLLESISFGILWGQEKSRVDDARFSIAAPCGYFNTDDIIENGSNHQIKDALRLIKADLENGVTLNDINETEVSNFAHMREWMVSLILLGIYFGKTVEAAGYSTVSLPEEKVFNELEEKYRAN